VADLFAYLGHTEAGIQAPDGMVVFGFGRKAGAVPLLTEPRTFYVGFHAERVRDAAAHMRTSAYLHRLLR
jgi:hypothetical protein